MTTGFRRSAAMRAAFSGVFCAGAERPNAAVRPMIAVAQRTIVRYITSSPTRKTGGEVEAARFYRRDEEEQDDTVIDWLLDADPSIRWQVMRDLTDAPAELVVAERARVTSEGWGKQLLHAQRDDGNWGDGVGTPLWWSNMYTLVFLRDLGVEPTSSRTVAAI